MCQSFEFWCFGVAEKASAATTHRVVPCWVEEMSLSHIYSQGEGLRDQNKDLQFYPKCSEML